MSAATILSRLSQVNLIKVFALVLGLGWAILWFMPGAEARFQKWLIIYEGPCVFKSYSLGGDYGNDLQLNVDCGGVTALSVWGSTIKQYIDDPRFLSHCIVKSNHLFSCFPVERTKQQK